MTKLIGRSRVLWSWWKMPEWKEPELYVCQASYCGTFLAMMCHISNIQSMTCSESSNSSFPVPNTPWCLAMKSHMELYMMYFPTKHALELPCEIYPVKVCRLFSSLKGWQWCRLFSHQPTWCLYQREKYRFSNVCLIMFILYLKIALFQ